MIWQDIAISAANLFAVFSLTAQVYYGFKEKTGPVKFLTSIPIFIGLLGIAYSFWTMGLHYSATITSSNAMLWFILFLQRVMYKK